MKLKKVLKNSLAMTLVFGTALGVAGCGKDKDKKTENKLPSIIDKNLEEEKEVVEIVNDGVGDYVDKIGFSTEEGTQIVDRSNARYGILVVKNETNHIGFYSLFHQKYLIAPQYTDEWLDYEVITDYNLGHFVKLKYKNIWYIYDSLGNVVYDSENDIRLASATVEVNDEIYVVVEEYSEDMGNYGEVAIKKYKENGKLETVDFIPDPIYEDDEDDEDDGNLAFGDLFVSEEKMDLEEYGVEGKYSLKSGNMYTVFNTADNKKVSTFVVPTSNHAMIGDKILYQTQQEVGVDAKKYTFAMGESKMLVKTYVVDILTGKTEEIETVNLFGNVQKYKDEEGKYTYALATMYEVEDKSLVAVPKSVLIDEKGNVVREVTGYELEDFIKIGNNYYNETTKIIYDAELNEIAYLGYINPVHYEEDKIFVGQEDGKYGAVGYDGKVVIPFVYDSLDPLENGKGIDFKDDCLIARKGSEYFRVNKATGAESNLGPYVSQLYEDLYLMKNEQNDVYTFMSQSEEYAIHNVLDDVTNQTRADKMYLSELLGEYVISTIETSRYDTTDEKYYYTTTYFTHAVKEVPNASSFVTIGSEVTAEEEIGDSFENAINLTLGENKVHLYGLYNNGGNLSYLEFTPAKGGKYIFEFEDTPVIYSGYFHLFDENENQIYALDATDEERKAFAYELEAGKKYYVRGIFDVAEYRYSTVTVKENTGEFFDHPLILAAPYGEMNIDFEAAGQDYVYVEFTPVESTGYEISGQNIRFLTGVTNENSYGGVDVESTSLTEDTPVKFRVEKIQDTDGTATFKIELTNKTKDGSTLLNGRELTGESGTMTNGYATTFYEYTSPEDALKNITFTKTTGTPTIKIYNHDFEMLRNFTFNVEKIDMDYVFSAGEKVYIEINDTTEINVTLKTINAKTVNSETGEYEASELTITNTEEYYKFVPDSTKIYAFNVGNDDLSDPDVDITLYDDNLNAITTYTATQNNLQLVTEQPLEAGKTYYIHASSDKVNDTTSFEYTLTYQDITLYTLSFGESEEYFDVASDGTITLTNSEMTTAEEFLEGFKIILPRKSSITFEYDLNKFVSSYNAGYMTIYENLVEDIELNGYYNDYDTYENTSVESGVDIMVVVYKAANTSVYNGAQPILTISNISIRLL